MSDKHTLTDGLSEEQKDELGNLDRLTEALAAYDTPEPDTDNLLATLKARRETVPEAASHKADATQPDAIPWHPPRQDMSYWLRVARSQMAFLDPVWWTGLLAVLVLGLLLIMWSGESAVLWLYALAAPMLAALSTAYLFRPATKTMLELERISPLNITELVYARLLLVVGLNTVLALILLLTGFTGTGSQIVIWRLLLIWLGPMIGLSGLALYISVRWNALMGAMLPLLLWGTLLLSGWQQISRAWNPSDITGLIALMNQSDVLLLTLVLLAAGIGAIWQTGRRVSEVPA
jgi:hypothetical protein